MYVYCLKYSKKNIMFVILKVLTFIIFKCVKILICSVVLYYLEVITNLTIHRR